MRIIGGLYGGQYIEMPKGLPVRPTTDRAKEALFNWLNQRVDWPKCHALDLFSGGGSVSMELLSYQVHKLTSVEINGKVLSHLKKLKTKYNTSNWTIEKSDALKFCAKEEKEYDLIFADPPYNFIGISELVHGIMNSEILSAGGYFILEHFSKLNFTEKNLTDKRVYGQSTFSIYNK